MRSIRAPFARQPDDIIVDELRFLLKHVVANLAQRIQAADFTEWAVAKATPIALAHGEAFVQAANRMPHLPRKSRQLYDLALMLHKGTHHIGLESDEKYFRRLSAALLPVLLPANVAGCASMVLYVQEAMLAYVLRPNVEYLATPYFINWALVENLKPPLDASLYTSTIERPPAPAARVPILAGIGHPYCGDSALAASFKKVMDDPVRLLAPFQGFMVKQGCIDEMICLLDLDALLDDPSVARWLNDAEWLHADTKATFVKQAQKICRTFLDTGKHQGLTLLPETHAVVEARLLAPLAAAPPPAATDYEEVLGVVRRDLRDLFARRHCPVFSSTDALFKALLKDRLQCSAKSRAGAAGKQRKAKKIDTAAQFEKEMKALGITQLPLPPSAVDEQHPDLVVKEEKKSRMFSLKAAKKKALGIPKAAFAQLSRGPSPTGSTANSPDMGRRDFSSKTHSTLVAASSRLSVSPQPTHIILSSSPAGSDHHMFNSNKLSTSPAGSDISFGDVPPGSRSRTNSEGPPGAGSRSRTNSEGPPGGSRSRTTSRSGSRSRAGSPITHEGTHTREERAQTLPSALATRSESAGEEAGSRSSTGAAGPALTLMSVEARIYSWKFKHKGSTQFVVYNIHITQESAAPGLPRSYASQGDTWTVERRYSEFASLEKKLKFFYPGLAVHLPQKKAFGRFEEEHIEQRRRALGTYLSELLANPFTHNDPRCTELLYWFLHPADEGRFKKLTKRSMWNKMAPSIKLETNFQAKEVDLRSFLDHFIVTAIEIEEDRTVQMAEQSAANSEAGEAGEAAAAAAGGAAVSPAALETTTWNVDTVLDPRVCAAAVGAQVLSDDCRLATFADGVLHLVGAVLGGLTGLAWWQMGLVRSGVATARTLFGASADDYFYWMVSGSLTYTPADVTGLLEMLRDMMFFPAPPEEVTEAEEAATEARARELVMALIPHALVQALPSAVPVEAKVDLCLDALQDQAYNKQLMLVLLDSLLRELFPELAGKLGP